MDRRDASRNINFELHVLVWIYSLSWTPPYLTKERERDRKVKREREGICEKRFSGLYHGNIYLSTLPQVAAALILLRAQDDEELEVEDRLQTTLKTVQSLWQPSRHLDSSRGASSNSCRLSIERICNASQACTTGISIYPHCRSCSTYPTKSRGWWWRARGRRLQTNLKTVQSLWQPSKQHLKTSRSASSASFRLSRNAPMLPLPSLRFQRPAGPNYIITTVLKLPHTMSNVPSASQLVSVLSTKWSLHDHITRNCAGTNIHKQDNHGSPPPCYNITKRTLTPKLAIIFDSTISFIIVHSHGTSSLPLLYSLPVCLQVHSSSSNNAS